MGTQLQAADLSVEDFNGLEGCNEILNLTCPDLIHSIHNQYFEAGADIIETNTFGALPWVLEEYGIAHRLDEICNAAGEIARSSADLNGGYVFAAIGPGTKLATLSQITFDDVVAGYRNAFTSLIRTKPDAILIETMQDLLNLKAAVIAAHEAMEDCHLDLPIFVQVTIEQNGTMLLGTEIAAALNFLECFPQIFGVGVNCATGPEEMSVPVRFLSQHSTRLLTVQPNAGLPLMKSGKSYYPLTPNELAEYHTKFVTEFGADIVGGCCGTTPDHIRAVANAVKNCKRLKRFVEDRWRVLSPKIGYDLGDQVVSPLIGCSSLYQFQPYDQSPSFLIVGERTNANGSKAFKDALASSNYDSLSEIAKDQEKEGAHVIDVCTAYVGRNEVTDMDAVLSRYITQITLPIMVDSTEIPVIETALKRIPGKCIINSIHYEDGGLRVEKVLNLCRKFGAAVVALTIDENGMAKLAEDKVAIAERILEQTRKIGIPDEDVFIDCLTFTLGSGDSEFRRSAIETLTAIRVITERYPRANTILGISNVSFGLKKAARHILNSVFLSYAIEAGLSSAIVHAGRILPINKIDPALFESAKKLIFDESNDKSDPLTAFLQATGDLSTEKSNTNKLSELPIELRLKTHIIDGIKQDLENSLNIALEKHSPITIINDFLLEGMKTVGDLFGAGKMQLPFVLQSAEVMKAAVSYLEPLMEKSDLSNRGSILLATVAGDVHDIGKNLVDIILSNNGYRVVNIGIKQPIGNILKEARDKKVDVIGMSGLLVKSTLVMRDNLLEMNERGLSNYPVILGGAALTRSYVEQDLRSLYKGNVWYASDAFEGLQIMDLLSSDQQNDTAELENFTAYKRTSSHRLPDSDPKLYQYDGHKSEVSTHIEVPIPPFWGRKTITNIDIKEVYPFINEIALFRGQWGFRRPKDIGNQDFSEFLESEARPVFERLKERLSGILQPKVVYGYFPVQSEGNDLIILNDDMKTPLARFRFPRQQDGKRLCIADFFKSVDSGIIDVAAFHIVTVGEEVTQIERSLFTENRYQEYLYTHGMGVETAEALAEYWHQKIRIELGISNDDPKDMKLLFSAKYRGCRYSFGYPACPNLEDQKILCDLLKPEEIGVSLTEEFMLVPEQSTSAIICHHPEAKYFVLR